jgi:anaerobic selenocysteine-containing dehydrogenase
MGLADPNDHAEFLKQIPFIVSWDIFANEFAEGFADILLPDTSYLETFTWLDGQAYSFNYPYGMDPWCYHISQPIVEPEAERRYIMDVCFDLMDRMGKRAELNEYFNRFIGLKNEERIQPGEQVSWEEVGNKALKHYFGPDKDLKYFKEKGCVIWPKKVEEAYWRHFTDARVPIYMEWMIGLKEKAMKIGKDVGINVRWEQYTPYISWFPCKPHLVQDEEYDLFCFSYRDILHTSSCTMEQPWLNEASMMSPYTYAICMNDKTAEEKGLKDHSLIEITSIYGPSVKGILKTRIGQHPKTIAIATTAGHWAAGQPVARGKGVHFNVLMKARFEESDPITLNLETSVKVKVSKVKGI